MGCADYGCKFYKNGTQIETLSMCGIYVDFVKSAWITLYDTLTDTIIFQSSHLLNTNLNKFDANGIKMQVVYKEHKKTVVMYFKIVDLNGDVWTGYSGYGVGVGFEKYQMMYHKQKNVMAGCERFLRKIFSSK